jgi:hypothetical protein
MCSRHRPYAVTSSFSFSPRPRRTRPRSSHRGRLIRFHHRRQLAARDGNESEPLAQRPLGLAGTVPVHARGRSDRSGPESSWGYPQARGGRLGGRSALPNATYGCTPRRLALTPAHLLSFRHTWTGRCDLGMPRGRLAHAPARPAGARWTVAGLPSLEQTRTCELAVMVQVGSDLNTGVEITRCSRRTANPRRSGWRPGHRDRPGSCRSRVSLVGPR